MKKFLKACSIFLMLLIVSFAPTQAQTEFDFYSLYFKSMDTTVNIEEDGLYTIDTTIVAQFNDTFHRGIEIWVPQDYEMKFTVSGNELTRKYYWPVKNITVDNEQYSTYEENNFKVIRIGNPDIYVSGERTYHYTYQIQTASLRVEDFQRIMWDVLGNDWQVPTENFSFTINLPKPVSAQPYVYSGMYGNVTNDKIEYTYTDTSITGHSVQPMQPGEAVTVFLDVPTDYFNFVEPANYLPVVLGIAGVMAVLSIFLFYRFGKDYPMVQTIEIDAPEGYSSAMVGYAFDGMAENRDVLSLIVQWASQGLLSIREIDKDNMELTKLKEISIDVPSYEAKFFNALFEKGDVIETQNLKDTFYMRVENAKNGLSHFFKKKQYQLFYSQSSFFKVLLTAVAPLILAAFVATTLFNKTGYSPITFPAFLITMGVGLVYAIFVVLGFTQYTIRSSSTKLVIGFIGLFFTITLLAILGSVMAAYDAIDVWLFVILVVFFGILIIAVNMTKRTKYGTMIQGKILGLRTFIKEAELNQLELLVHDDPTFFYRILPFAYVLNLSDTWSKKFETLAVPAPEWYVGTSPNFSTVIFMNSMNRMMYTTSAAMVSRPQPKSGSGGGGSFGGFGGGGGGFSGGGFGGGGGGGW